MFGLNNYAHDDNNNYNYNKDGMVHVYMLN